MVALVRLAARPLTIDSESALAAIDVALPVDVTGPVKFASVVTVAALPVMLPVSVLVPLVQTGPSTIEPVFEIITFPIR